MCKDLQASLIQIYFSLSSQINLPKINTVSFVWRRMKLILPHKGKHFLLKEYSLYRWIFFQQLDGYSDNYLDPILFGVTHNTSVELHQSKWKNNCSIKMNFTCKISTWKVKAVDNKFCTICQTTMIVYA